MVHRWILASLACLIMLADARPQAAWPSRPTSPDDTLQDDSQRSATPKVIYGNDDRIEAFQADQLSSNHSKITHADVMLVAKSLLTYNAEANTYSIYDFYRYNSVCPDERFYKQPNPGFCSGFLTESQTVVTAGHCLEAPGACENTAFIFDFRMLGESTDPEMASIPADRIYFCDHFIEFALGTDRGYDFAVVALDHAVEIGGTPRTPLSLGSVGAQQLGHEMILVGHPSGLPIKLAGGATVGWSDPRSVFFEANVDSYAGNSGSMIVNADSFDIEGILVWGNEDFAFDRVEGCERSVMCNDTGCSSSSYLEGISSISSFESFLPNFEGLRLNKFGRQYAEIILGDISTGASYHFLIENTATEDISWSGEFLVLDGSTNTLSFETSSGTVPANGYEVVSLQYNPQMAMLDTETWILVKDQKWDHYREFSLSFVHAIDMMLVGNLSNGNLTAELGVRWEAMTIDTFPCGTSSSTSVPVEVFAVRFAENRTVDFVSSLPEETLLTVRGAYMHAPTCGGGGIFNYSVCANDTYFVYVAHIDSTFFPPSFSLSVLAANDSDFTGIVARSASFCPVIHDFSNSSGTFTDGSPLRSYYGSDLWVCFRLDATAVASNAQAWIQFTRINIEAYFDYIIVHDGESEFSPVLGEISGLSSEPWLEIFASTSGYLFLQFRTDGSVERSGFELQYYMESPACNSSAFRCSSGECVPSSSMCDGAIDCADKSDESVCELESWCLNITTFINRTGGFSDGSADDGTYASDRFDCFLIEPTVQAADESVWVEFTRFSIELNVDYLYIFDGANDYSPELYSMTGVALGGPGLTASSSLGTPLFLLFHTDHLINEAEGWELTYYTSDEGPVCTAAEFECDAGGCVPPEWECDDTVDCIDSSDEHFGCIFDPERGCTTLTMSRGTLMDGQGVYDNYAEECYEIVPEFEMSRGDSLWLRFSYFDVELNFDYVHIYDGPDADNAEFIQSLTGEYGHYASVDLDTFQSESGSFYLEFRTDGSATREGWTLVYWVGREEDYCPRYTLDDRSSMSGPSANNECVFPFRHDGVMYYNCANTLAPGVTDGPRREWCATDVGLQNTVFSWGYCNLCQTCEPRQTSDAMPQSCEFPFSYDGRMYYDCATADNDGIEWCATETNSELTVTNSSNCSVCVSTYIGIVADSDSAIDPSEECGRMTTSKATCIFPFIYEGQTFDDCTWNVTGLNGGLCAVEVDDNNVVVGELEECVEVCFGVALQACQPTAWLLFPVAFVVSFVS